MTSKVIQEPPMKMPIPREHGAWALLFGPFLATVAVSRVLDLSIVLLLASLLGTFLAHEPLAKLTRSKRQGTVSPRRTQHWKRWLSVYSTVALISGGILVLGYDRWLLVPIALGVSLMLALHLALTFRRQERSATAELVGVLGLTSTAPATYYVIHGSLGLDALLLWTLTFLYFASAVFYVKMRVSRILGKTNAKRQLLACALYHIILIFGIGALIGFRRVPSAMALAYLPLLLRTLWGMVSRPEKLNLKKIGYSEVALTILFLILFVAGWQGSQAG